MNKMKVVTLALCVLSLGLTTVSLALSIFRLGLILGEDK